MVVSFILPVILFTIVWIISRIIFYKKNKPINKTREIFINLFFIYFLILVNFTLFKYGYLMLDYDLKFYINYIPFIETIKMFTGEFSDINHALYNVIGNILLFVPLGFCIPLFFNKKNKLTKVILYGFSSSLTIELLQLFTPNNITDIDDIIFNILGSIIGFILFNIIYSIFKNTKISAFIESLSCPFDGNLIIKTTKPILVMILLSVILSFSFLYSGTISGNISNNELASEVFGSSSIEDYKISKNFEDYKFLLSDNDDFIELKTFKRTFINRWYHDSSRSFDSKNCNYSLLTLQENNLISGVVFGKNIDANTIQINFKGTKYTENLNENEYFIVPFPNFENVDDLTDFYNFFEGKESLDLQIKFYYKDGSQCTNMEFSY